MTGASSAGSSRAAARCSRGWSCSLSPHDLTGGYKAWRPTTLGACRWTAPRRRLRLPDRDDLPRRPARRADRGGPDHFATDTWASARCRGGSSARRWWWCCASAGKSFVVAGGGSGRSRSRAGDARALMARLARTVAPAGAPLPGVRVVMDLRPLQEPERLPITAATSAACSRRSRRRRSRASPS